MDIFGGCCCWLILGDIVYQCSGMNDPVARAGSVRPLWVQLVDRASLVLAEDRPQVWAHSAERCAL